MALTPEFGVRLPVAGPLSNTEAVWVHDFLAWTTYQDRHHVSCGSVEALEAADAPPMFMESITNMAFLAGVTNTIDIGVAVLCLPYRNPIVAAKQVANIDVLSNGRLILGIGTGAPKSTNNVDFEVLGVPRKTKYDVTRDYLRAMMEIWTTDQSSYEGEHISFPESEFFPKPVQKPWPRIWAGGHGPTAQDIVAEFCTGWIPPWIAPEGYGERIDNIHRLAAEKGRADAEITIASEIYVSIADTDDQAIKSSRRTLEVLPYGFDHTATPEAVARAGLIGSGASIAEKIAQYVDVGVKHYEMKFIYHTVDHLIEQLEQFAAEVTPNFR
jgi:alkanesulfonate monooxygenase SsuD/methylene tetrahydromethanopterin reductase-like flavin-dependent oxidoreductase (luciferase family)